MSSLKKQLVGLDCNGSDISWLELQIEPAIDLNKNKVF